MTTPARSYDGGAVLKVLVRSVDAKKLGEVEVVRLLQEVFVQSDPHKYLGLSPFHLAVLDRQVDLAGLMLAKGAEVDSLVQWRLRLETCC